MRKICVCFITAVLALSLAQIPQACAREATAYASVIIIIPERPQPQPKQLVQTPEEEKDEQSSQKEEYYLLDDVVLAKGEDVKTSE